MKLTKKTTADILKVYDTWLHSYLNGDVATYDMYLDDAYHFIGSTQNEEFLNRKDTTRFFEATADQLAGKCELKNEKRTLEKFGELVFVTHLFDAWFLNGTDWAYYGRFRFTSALQEKKEGWRFIYQHFSTTDAKAEAGETIGFDQVSAENLQLKEAIKRRTFELEAKNRELEVEGALERIRAQAVAMKASSDLLDIVVTMRNEFTKLGHEAHYFWHMMWLPDTYEKAMTSGDGARIGMVMELPRDFHGKYEDTVAWEKSKEPIHILAMDADTAVDYIDRMITLGNFQQVDPNAPSLDDVRQIGGLTFIMARTTHGEIGYSLPGVVKHPPAEDLKILEQFAGAFDLAHRRFLDLKKAEIQTREVQIELALEKVRSRTMAMQHSDELSEVAVLLFNQVKSFGLESWGCGFNIWEKDQKVCTSYFTTDEGLVEGANIPLTEDPIFRRFYESRQQGEDFWYQEISGPQQLEHHNYINTLPGIGEKLKSHPIPKFQIDHVVNFSHGNLIFITYEPYPEAHDIFKRFGKVFEQTYTRFLDLKKAEAQAREAQIQLGLERVRAKAMAMRTPDDLKEVGIEIWCQIEGLGQVDLEVSVVHLYEKDSPYFKSLAAIPGPSGDIISLQSFFPVDATTETQQMMANYWAGKKEYTIELTRKKARQWQKIVLENNPDLGSRREDMINDLKKPDQAEYWNFSDYSGGSLLLVTHAPPTTKTKELLRRSANVFDLAYKRYQDLVHAEAQAREAQIEAALERVRGRALAMHQSEELLAVIQVVSEQLLLLNLSFDTVSFGKNNQEGDFKFWLTSSGQPKPVLIEVPFLNSPVLKSVITAQKKEMDFIADVFNPIDTRAWSQHLIQHSLLKNFPKAVKDFILHSPGFARSSFLMQHIDLYVGNYRAMPFTDEENAIFKRFAQVFAQAYTRFLDLQKAEAQAREAEIELALERVRARSMAMQSSEEFVETSDVMLAELKKLKMNAMRIGICTMDAKTEASEIWSRSETKERLENKILGVVPKGVHLVFDNMVKAWKKKQPYFTDTRTGKEVKEYYKKLLPYLSYPLPKTYNAAETISAFFFQEGSLNVVSHTPLQEDDIKIMLRFSQVFGQVYRRFLDLQKAEAQAKEAQIENALEKVRSRSLAMRQSKELLDVITEIGLQLEILGITLDSSFINIYKDESPKDLTIYIAAGGRTYKEPVFVPFINNPLFTKILKARKNKDSFYALVLDKKQTIAFWKHFFPNATNIEVPRNRKNYIAKSKGIATSVSLGKYASIHMMRYTPIPYLEEENQILMRFGKVFDQVYTRFLDLQKAEAQAREAQIEASLERVRSQAMAMRQSEDLIHCTRIVFDELEKLDLSIERSGIGIFDPETKDCELWTTVIGQDGKKELATGVTSLTVHPMLIETFNAWEKQEPYSYILEGKELEAYYKLVTKSDFVLSEDVIEKSTALPKEYYHYSPFGAGGLYFFSDAAPTDGDKLIIRRFAEVFDLTYTRYEDLQKAEAQAREAQIEAALERVRSKAMAMRSSEDIGEATTILFKEIEKLEIESMRCGILIIHDTQVMDVWTTSSTKDDGIVRVSGQIDMTIHPLFKNVYRGWEAKESHTNYELRGKDGEAYYQALAKEAHYQLPSSSVVKDRHYNTCFMFNEGALFAFTKDQIPAAALKIFKRFAKVFGLTYQRYRELIESEKREKEAKKQSSLDRVRGEIASMRSTEDLNRITPIIWQELTNLGVPFFRCGIFIMNEENANIQVYLSDPNGKSLGLMNLDFSTNALTKNSVEAWRKRMVYKAHWSKEEFINWTKTLIDLGKIKTKQGYQGGDDAPESLDLHFVPFSQGMLYVGNLKPLTEEQIELVVNLSESFSIAYARYEDFNKLERAKENVEAALKDLKSAQNQLIQSEKMASLGELTAGIAHEIQNPLNFVNNFSEVSKELLEEMMEEMAKGDMEEVKAIADDIIQNLDKINHHGKRADGIVKGMLQHSRSSTGKKEPTDINTLADEYLRLAYHGLRAKDPSFNATLETDYDDRLGKIHVIPQDMGRVLLNLITNAFYAANERKKMAKDPAFMPTVSIKTIQKDHQVIISVQDNGQGIPKKVLDKIFQPFFTTKPTGEGTGLGLSMSYDIVTKGHGGELKVETKAGLGTTFYVNLPVTK